MGGFVAKCLLLVVTAVAYADCKKETGVVNSDVPSKTTVESKQTRTANLHGEKMMGNENDKAPKLDAEISLHPDVLEVKYRIKNTTEKAIFVFNVIWDFDKSGNVVPAPFPAYVTMNPQGTLIVAKQVAPLPRTRKIESRIIPFVTRVEAGNELSETIKLPVPVEEYNPYFPKEPTSETEDRSSTAVVFTLQYIRETDGIELKPSGLGDSLSLWHPNLFSAIETLSSNQKAAEVKVKKRIGPFESF